MHWWACRRQDRLNRSDVTRIAWFLGNFLAILSLGAVVAIEGVTNWVPLFALVLASTVLMFPKIPGVIPGWFTKLTNVLLVFFLIIDFVTSEFVQALINLNVLLILLRSLSYRSTREDMQLIVLCLFVIVIMGVLSMSVMFGIQIIMFSCCAMALLFVINLRDNGMSMVPTSESFEGFSWPVFMWLVFKKLDIRHVAFGGLLFGLLMGISGIIFVAFPRFGVGKPIPFLKLKDEGTFAGFSEDVSFGEVTDIKADTSVAMRIDIPDVSGMPAAPYWRMLVLDQYSNGHLAVSEDVQSKLIERTGVSMFAYRPYFVAKHFPSLGTDRWTVYLEGGISRYIPATGIYRELFFQNEQSFVFNSLTHTLNLKEESSGVLFYQVTGMSFDKRVPDYILPNTREPITRRMLEEPDLFLSSEYPGTTLELPVSDTEKDYLADVVKTISKYYPVDNFEQFAIGASLWLESEHPYSVSLGALKGDGDPLIEWMKSKSPGHCEYFAGALILICRAAGIPARVVTGFHGGSWNGYEDYFMVRNSDAHAWVEVFDGDEYWVRVDPTPGGTQEIISMNDALVNVPAFSEKGFTAYMDSLKILWYRRIVNFNTQSQVEMVEDATVTAKAMFEGLIIEYENFVQTIKMILSDPFAKERVTLFSILFGGLFFFYLLGRFILSRLRARSYFKFFGTRKRKKIAQLRERVLAGKFLGKLDAVAVSVEGDISKTEFEKFRGALRMIRFGPVDSWPPTKLTIKKVKVFMKTL